MEKTNDKELVKKIVEAYERMPPDYRKVNISERINWIISYLNRK